MDRKPEIILALDVDSFDKAKGFIDRVYPEIKTFKVGLQLFTCVGPQIIDFINKKGADVFLDLKFFDIPNTVAGAVREVVRHKVKMFTLHIAGGRDMLRGACEAVQSEAAKLNTPRPLLIGVTVLTSSDASSGQVLGLAREGLDSGLDGVVCSVRETAFLRKEIPRDFFIVTPGIRPVKADKDDQKRVATVKEAAAAGSNFLVVGRPILEASDPVIMIKTMKEDIIIE